MQSRPEIKFKMRRCQCLQSDKETHFRQRKLCWESLRYESMRRNPEAASTLNLCKTSHHHQWFFRMNRNSNPYFGQKNSGFRTKSKLSDSGWKGQKFYRHVPHLFRLHFLWKDLSASLLISRLMYSPMNGNAGGPGIFSIKWTNRARLRL